MKCVFGVTDWVLSSLQLHALTDMVLPAVRACLSLEGQRLCFLGGRERSMRPDL